MSAAMDTPNSQRNGMGTAKVPAPSGSGADGVLPPCRGEMMACRGENGKSSGQWAVGGGQHTSLKRQRRALQQHPSLALQACVLPTAHYLTGTSTACSTS